MTNRNDRKKEFVARAPSPSAAHQVLSASVAGARAGGLAGGRGRQRGHRARGDPRGGRGEQRRHFNSREEGSQILWRAARGPRAPGDRGRGVRGLGGSLGNAGRMQVRGRLGNVEGHIGS